MFCDVSLALELYNILSTFPGKPERIIKKSCFYEIR